MVILIYSLRHQLMETVRKIDDVNYWFLLLIIPLQLLDYDAYSRMYRDMLRHLKQPVAYKSLSRVSLELNFVNHAFPSGGISGISFFGLRLKSYGVKGSTATLVQLLKFFMIFISFQALIAVGLFALAVGGKTNNLILLIAGSLATLTLVGTALSVYIISDLRRIDGFFTFLTKVLNRIIQIIRPKHPETINIGKLKEGLRDMHEAYESFEANPRLIRSSLFYALIANICELMTLYVVYLAFGFGDQVNIGAIIIAYAVANFAGLISVLPGGVGAYEALMTGALAAGGIRAALSIPVVLMYRVLSMAVQLLPGWVLYQRWLRQEQANGQQ